MNEMDNIKELLGKRIKEIRIKKNISQQELAELANIDQRSLSHIECGDTFPSKSLLNLSNALGVELHELFEFNHLDLKSENMINFIIDSLKSLSIENLKIIYRLIKILKS